MRSIGISRGAMAREDLRDALRGAHSPEDVQTVLKWNRKLGGVMKRDSGLSIAYVRVNYRNRVPIIQEDGTRSYGAGLQRAVLAKRVQLHAQHQALLADLEIDLVRGLSAEQLQAGHRELRNEDPEVVGWDRFIADMDLLKRIGAEMVRRHIEIDGDLPGRAYARPTKVIPKDDPEVLGTLGNDSVALRSYHAAETMRHLRKPLIPVKPIKKSRRRKSEPPYDPAKFYRIIDPKLPWSRANAAPVY